MDSLCPHGIDVELIDCGQCAELIRGKWLTRKPVHARPAGEDTSGDRRQSHGAQDGLTLREHYAGLALQGLLASDVDFDPRTFANKAVTVADALIEELAK